MNQRNIGAYHKFVINRIDKQDCPGGKHENCRLFVLDVDHDKFAVPALKAYADACSMEYPLLAEDLRHWVKEQELHNGKV